MDQCVRLIPKLQNLHAVLFSEKDFKSNFSFSGNFVPVGQFFSGQPLNFLQIGSRKWGVGVKWKLLGRLGKMAARSDAARQAPPGHPGLQHTSVRPPSDAIPPRYCRDSALPPYSSERWGSGTNPTPRQVQLTSHFLVYDQTLRVRLFTTDHGSFLRHCKVLVYT